MRKPRLGSAAKSFRRCNSLIFLQCDSRAFHAFRSVSGLTVTFVLMRLWFPSCRSIGFLFHTLATHIGFTPTPLLFESRRLRRCSRACDIVRTGVHEVWSTH